MREVRWDAHKYPQFNKHIWAPELHDVMGQLILLFAGDDGHNRNHRMHALVARDPKDPTSAFDCVGPVSTEDNHWAIDMTYWYDDRPELTQEQKGLYAIWSGWLEYSNRIQNIYIAKTKKNDPFAFETERHVIATAEYPWERSIGRRIQEGPAVVKHDGMVHLLTSNNCSWTPFYNIGIVRLEGVDPLAKNSWHKREKPLLQSHGDVYGPGHPSVTTDEQENLVMAHHSAESVYGGWNRVGRLSRLAKDALGELVVQDYIVPKPQQAPNHLQWAFTHLALAGNMVMSMVS